MTPLRDQVISMLTALGVTGATTDPLLDILLQNVHSRILNKTNQSVTRKGWKAWLFIWPWVNT